jgi:hypothetical protein
MTSPLASDAATELAKPSASDVLTELAAETRRLADRFALGELVDRYLLALDEGTFDQARAAGVFTADAALAFPPGDHHGLPGLAEFTSSFMAHWLRTHHHASNYVISLDGDRARIAWNVIATHVHPGSPAPPAPGRHFQLGGTFDGVALRTAGGWRLRRLELRVVWTTGTGVPSIAATMAGAGGADE